jgi:UPF0755 protein
MNDILPPKRPLNPNAAPAARQSSQFSATNNVQPRPISPRPTVEPRQPAQQQKMISGPPSRPLLPARKRSVKKWLWWSIGGFLGLLAIAVAAMVIWYQTALQSVVSTEVEKTPVQIVEGSSPSEIGNLLQNEGLIRSSFAFDIYVRLHGVRGLLQAGTYQLAASSSTPEIVSLLTSGNVDSLTVTFLPGATLAENRQVLFAAGFSQEEVDAALTKTYDSPLFADKPEGSDLEGYIYGETYTFDTGVSVEEILQQTFAEYWQAIEQNDIVAGFQAQGLNLFEGITLASIAQREDGNPTHQANVARIFLNRLEQGMLLGSDVTYYYGAEKLGVEPSSDLDSPYNTRLHAGLPPGPISNPGLTALKAVAQPAENDYLYFISGDDDVLYMAMTNEEHEMNVQQHCAVKCQLP